MSLFLFIIVIQFICYRNSFYFLDSIGLSPIVIYVLSCDSCCLYYVIQFIFMSLFLFIFVIQFIIVVLFIYFYFIYFCNSIYYCNSFYFFKTNLTYFLNFLIYLSLNRPDTTPRRVAGPCENNRARLPPGGPAEGHHHRARRRGGGGGGAGRRAAGGTGRGSRPSTAFRLACSL